MKKQLTFSLCAGALLLALTGCGADADEFAESPESIPAETAADPELIPAETTALSLEEETAEPALTAADIETPENADTPDPEALTDAEETTASAFDYKAAYKSQLLALSSLPKQTGLLSYTIEYTLFDMNGDDIPELAVKTGTCEADFQITFYTSLNGCITTLGEGFPGGHAAFMKDTDLNQLVIQWGHMGTGGLLWYECDGNTVTVAKQVDNIDYLNADDVDAVFNTYGNFAPLDYLYCVYSNDAGVEKWSTYSENGTNDTDTIDLSLLMNY